MKKKTAYYLVFCLISMLFAGCSDGGKVSESGTPTPAAATNTPTATAAVTPISTEPSSPKPSPTPEVIPEPVLVKTEYHTDYTVVADINVTNEPYNADNTGQTDVTDVLIKAINDCSKRGGGTVYLPKGQYKITKPVTVHPFVTVIGDWQDPEEGTDYGTVIIADIEPSDKELPALFTIGGSAGVSGLTIYYPNQSIDDVKPYPYTFYIPGSEKNGYYMLQTISNCTVINGYRGIATSRENPHELMTVRNVRGTFLSVGANVHNSADVDTWDSVIFDNKYWAEAGGGFTRADKAKLDAYIRENGTGMIISDLEWAQFSDISVSGYNTGIHIIKGTRISFTG
ncbi:MAG TPA: glycosyl hydrolase family 28-related protein, partial [Clostridia bacterium]|nr:glycosyl hydrolase family 28-related protein [Clostridia bacterium]